MFTVYFAVFALGRLVGSTVQKKTQPATTLVVGAAVALCLLAVIVTAKGPLAIAAVTAIGFFVSIFFPTLYALAIEGLGEQTSKASGLLTMGFLGCAVLPVLQGWLADQPGLGLQRSYALSFVAYLCVLAYAWNPWNRQPKAKRSP
jgi:FHS family L-fucose permease-like MFS transporter